MSICENVFENKNVYSSVKIQGKDLFLTVALSLYLYVILFYSRLGSFLAFFPQQCRAIVNFFICLDFEKRVCRHTWR